MTKLSAVSWPAPPYSNRVIEHLANIVAACGFRVSGGYPPRWRTPFTPTALYLIHWPELIVNGSRSQAGLWARIMATLVNLAILRCRGTRVVWIVHNARPHELSASRRAAWRFYSAGLSRLVSGWLTLAPSTAPTAMQAFPVLRRKPRAYVWHPPYNGAEPTCRNRAQEILSLPNAGLLIGHVGLLRGYKRLDDLVEVFGEYAGNDVRLVIAGNPLPASYGEHLLRCADADPRVVIKLGFLNDSSFDLHLAALDVFVAPYGDYLHSGALIHALCRGCVVVAPDSPFARDLRDAVGDAWVVLYGGSLSATVLDEARERAEAVRGSRPNLDFLSEETNVPRFHAFLSLLGLRAADCGPHGVREGDPRLCEKK
ncbi:MAG: glycosyltransferase family 1 protein [Rhodospirillales bacterium]|nr:MAG: glycosyltransferase family 1 protein [Rhodospirillales bacterium]